MFVKVKETKYNSEFYVNTDTISVVYTESNTIILNCVTGDSNGIYHLTEESMQRLNNVIRR